MAKEHNIRVLFILLIVVSMVFLGIYHGIMTLINLDLINIDKNIIYPIHGIAYNFIILCSLRFLEFYIKISQFKILKILNILKIFKTIEVYFIFKLAINILWYIKGFREILNMLTNALGLFFSVVLLFTFVIIQLIRR